MKRLILSALLFLFLVGGYSQGNLFSVPSLVDFMDVESLTPLSDRWYIYDLEASTRATVRKVDVRLTRHNRNGRNERYTFFYNSRGLLEKEESKVLESESKNYVYDEKSRLISGGAFSYQYIDDFQRERYWEGKLQYKETVEFQKDKILITVTSCSKKDDGSIVENSKKQYEYIFDGDRLSEICKRTWYRIDVEQKERDYVRFYYDKDGLLQKLTESHGDSLRAERLFEYQDKKLARQTVRYPLDPTSDFIAEYADYDAHGNFLRCIQTYIGTNKELRCSFEREIEYIE